MKERKVRVSTAVMLVILTVVTTFNITFFAATDYYNRKLDGLAEMEARYSKLKTVAEIVEKHFVAEYDESEAIEYALMGYVDGLGDVWSAYYTAEQTAEIEEDEANTYVGIGVTYSTEPEHLYELTAVTAGGPADQAGLLPGDKLVAVDGTALAELPADQDVADLVKGESGTVVNITVSRGGAELTFACTRAAIRVYSTSARMLDGNIGYISISDFDSGVHEEFAEHLIQLKSQGAKGYIFDVRNNPGGYLSVMHDILDGLLPEGIVITTVDKAGNETPFTSDYHWIEMPMVVLTNEYSVSAAEFFAAALQEYGVATIVGGQTSGKGYSQQTFMLEDGSSVHISTTRYYTPKGNSLAETGVTPDRVVEMPLEDIYSLASGKLADADDEQLQTAIAILTQEIAELPVEETGEQTGETTTPAE